MKTGRAFTQGGRKDLRKALYMGGIGWDKIQSDPQDILRTIGEKWQVENGSTHCYRTEITCSPKR